MQRQFSNRGEALAEVTAARMLARRQQSAKSAFAAQGGRPARADQWFLKPSVMTQRSKTKQPRQDKNTTSLL